MPLRLKNSGVAPVGATPRRVDADDLLRVRVVDQRLRLAAPAERVPHRAGGGEHRARGVDRVAALLEHHRAGRRGERLAGDRHPVRAVQRRLLRLLRQQRRRDQHDEYGDFEGAAGHGAYCKPASRGCPAHARAGRPAIVTSSQRELTTVRAIEALPQGLLAPAGDLVEQAPMPESSSDQSGTSTTPFV